jgi:CPA2 family monovalent cation:H+ antiporter-2
VLEEGWLRDLMIVLATAGVVVPLFGWLRLGVVPGFLVCGVILGPGGLGHLVSVASWLDVVTFSGPEEVQPFAELGVVFLLFLIGLEFSFERLWSMRRLVFGMGSAQFLISGLLILGCIVWFVDNLATALVIGFAFALSSTAIATQLMISTRRFASPAGRLSLAVLLFQDLMVVPIVIAVGLIGGEEAAQSGTVFRAIGLAAAAVTVIIVAGRYLVAPLMRLAGNTGSRELLVGIAMFLAIGTALVTASVGLSSALGAFLAGILLGDNEYRHQLEVDLEPFKGLLLGLFFMTVGMSLDLVTLWMALPLFVGLLLALLILKIGAMCIAGAAWRIALPVTIESAFILAGAGEFAFVVFSLARGVPAIDSGNLQTAITIAALSMLVMPLLAMAGRRLADRLAQKRGAEEHGTEANDIPEFHDHVVIGGYGRVGEMVARVLDAEQIPYIALDLDAGQVAARRKAGDPVFFGDASRGEILERVGGGRAHAFVVTTDEPAAAGRMVRAIKAAWPDAAVYARAVDADHARGLREAGAVYAVPEALEGSLQLAGRLLQYLGLPDDVVDSRLEFQRAAEIKRLAGPPKP